MADPSDWLTQTFPTAFHNEEVARALMVLMKHLSSKDLTGEKSHGPDTDPWLTPKEAARYAAVSDDTLRIWINAGHLPAGRRGRIVRVKRSDIDAFLKGGSANDRAGGDANSEVDSQQAVQSETTADSTSIDDTPREAARDILKRFRKKRR